MNSDANVSLFMLNCVSYNKPAASDRFNRLLLNVGNKKDLRTLKSSEPASRLWNLSHLSHVTGGLQNLTGPFSGSGRRSLFRPRIRGKPSP